MIDSLPNGRQLLLQFEKNYCLFKRLENLIHLPQGNFKIGNRTMKMHTILIDEYSSFILFKTISPRSDQTQSNIAQQSVGDMMDFYDQAPHNPQANFSMTANVDLDTKTCSVYSYMGSAMPMFPALTKKYRDLQVYEKVQCNRLLTDLLNVLVRQSHSSLKLRLNQ